MVGWHHQLNGNEFEKALWVGDGQGSLVFCSPWGGKESDRPEQLCTKRVEPKSSHYKEKHFFFYFFNFVSMR